MGVLDRFRREDGVAAPAAPPAGDTATLADVEACYRLLLRRDADEGGLAHYGERVERDHITVDDLVEAFLGSEEFLHRHGNLVRVRRERRRVETAEGFVMHVDPQDWAVGSPVARTGTYEPEVTAALRSVLAPGMTFVDVGANVGWYSLLAGSVLQGDGRIVAVEPNPDNCRLIEQSAAENGFETITVVTAGASDVTALAALDVDASNGRIVVLDPDRAGEVVPCSFVVPLRPIDDLLPEVGVGRVDVMKVDVEGVELQVLRGAEATLRRDRPVLVSEFFPLALRTTGGCDPRDYLRFLRGVGYELSVIGSGDGPASDDDVLAAAGAEGRDHVDLLATPV